MHFAHQRSVGGLSATAAQREPQWLKVQSDYKAALAAGKSDVMTNAAKAADKASHAELNALRRLPFNNVCFDCNTQMPGWAVLPHGIFVCIDCAQVHRRLGRHISQVKAINTGTYLWYPHELEVMRCVGNQVASLAYHAPEKLSAGASPECKLERAKAVYEAFHHAPDFVGAVATLRQQSKLESEQSSLPVANKPPFTHEENLTQQVHGRDLMTPEGLSTDLISLSDELPKCPPVSCQRKQDNQASLNVTPEAAPSALLDHDRKKANILAMFAPQSCSPRAAISLPKEQQLFFSQYGL
mmetsp:Transcript_1699/g.3561  ORF Transcript_1699/g.3561 Transcript_1699/m.3561 type:complete len:298 (-) Transcript_1699:516-1409(-)